MMALIRCLSFLSVFLSLAGVSCAQAIAAWHNTYGAQVLVQNSTTGDVYYSNCNSNGPPVFPTSPLNVFPFTTKPKLGSAFAGSGYTSDSTVYAQIWYTDTEDNIWQVLAQCSTDNQTFTVTGTYFASANITTTISSSTGLAALLLGGTSGYRVFFHNSTGNVHQLVYTPKNGWGDGTPLSPDVPKGKSLSAAFYGTSNLSIVYPLNANAIEISEYNSDGKFHDSSFPYPLSDTGITSNSKTASTVNTTASIGDNALVNWSASSATVGMTMDSTAKARRVFYIDSEGLLQYYSCDLAASVTCTLQDRQNTTYWAVADDPNAAMGTAYVDRTGDLFYFSDSKLVMVQMVAGAWAKLRTLTDQVSSWSTTETSTSSSSSPSTSSSSGTDSTGTAASSSSSGMSSGAIAGVVVAVLVFALGVAVGAFFMWRRKRPAKNNGDDAAAAGGDNYAEVPPADGNFGKYEMETTPAKAITEADSTPIHSPVSPQDNNAIPHEVSGHSATSEMEAKPVVRYELM